MTTVANVAAPSWFRIFLAAVRSEWLKLRTVRSTIWALLVTLVITGKRALSSVARVSRWDRLDPRDA